MKLQSKQAVITGGASGIGAATCRMFASEGANVGVLDINLEGAEAVASEIRKTGRKAIAVKADVACKAEVDSAMQQIIDEFGHVDILVNNAGVIGFARITETTEAIWRRAIGIHLDGAFYCTRAVIEGMIARKWGRLINISSVVGLNGSPNHSAYSASKAGIIGFTKALAKELGPVGITANVVAPGSIITPMYSNAYSGDSAMAQKLKQDRLAYNLARIPLGRQGTVDEVAATILFLCSDDAAFFTGQVLSPNGGYYM
ncbi:MAG: SDR family oxidoreductase [Chloroflexi bacterium]|nr:SDR family oxidoreductase [Chloroflexota bacterium]